MTDPSSINVVDIDQENAKQYLIDESFNRIVMIDFWADWCAPCKSLMPLLEKLAEDYQGQFLLARVNADAEPMISSQFGVRSLPTVVLMKDGQPLDGFTGAQPETAVRELLEKHLPKVWDVALLQARELMAAGNYVEALPLLKEAYDQSNHQANIGIALSHAYIENNRLPEAQAILDAIGLADQDQEYLQVKGMLELKLEAGKSPEIEALEKQLAENPSDVTVAYQLAVQYSQDGHAREALELMYDILRKDLNAQEGAVKKSMMDFLAALGKGDPLAVEFQRKIYTLLY